MNWKTVVVVSSLATYLYLVITEWVNLFPWNDVSTSTASQKLSGTLVNTVPFALLVAAFMADRLWLKILAMGILLVMLGVHFAWWWVPYFWGASKAHLESYARLFSQTYRFLPARGSNPVPDAHYVTYHVLVLADLFIAMVALTSGQRARG